jgi:hypothetical protein
MRRLTTLVVALLPGAVASLLITVRFLDTSVVLDALWRPLGIAIALGIAIQVVVVPVLRDHARGSVIAAIIVFALVETRVGLVAAVAYSALLVYEHRAHRRLGVERAVTVVVAVMVFLTAARVASGPIPGVAVARAAMAGEEPSADGSGPDMFLILLDGYPRSDTLLAWGYDNAWFEAALRERGFEVALRSETSVPITSVVLATMLHGRHPADVPVLAEAAGDGGLKQKAALARAIAEAPAWPLLRDAGYGIVSAGQGRTDIALPADEYVDDATLTGFELILVRESVFGFLLQPDMLAAQHREKVGTAIGAASEVAERDGGGPIFMLSHVMSPHTPIVFERDGGPVTPGCLPRCELWTILADGLEMDQPTFERAYSGQVHHLNTLLLDAVDRILAARPNAVIVLFSDHGSRGEEADREEWYRTFLAARTPGVDAFDDDARPIDVLSRLFGAYLKSELPTPNTVQYEVPNGRLPLTMRPRS